MIYKKWSYNKYFLWIIISTETICHRTIFLYKQSSFITPIDKHPEELIIILSCHNETKNETITV